MWSLKTVIYLGLSALLADAAGTINLVTYDTTSPGFVMEWPGGATEYHCFYTPDGSAGPTYVKGTYGLFGYFEGPVDSGLTATVRYWGILPNSINRDQVTTVTYAADYGELDGGPWTAVNGTNNTRPTDAELKSKCLWSYDTVDGSKPTNAGFWVDTGAGRAPSLHYWVCDFNTTATYGSFNYSGSFNLEGYSIGENDETNASTIRTGHYYNTVGPSAGLNWTFLSVSLAESASATNPLQIQGFYCAIDATQPFNTSLCAQEAHVASTASTANSTTCSQFVDPSSLYAALSSLPSLSGASQVGPILALPLVLLCYQALAL